MRIALLCAMVIQGISIVSDEVLFHRHRPLPLWERIGHPLDTLSMLICLLIPLLLPFSPIALGIYVVLGALSCLWVTKDEAVHARLCRWEEHWLHAVLFLIHPTVLIFIGLCWSQGANGDFRPYLSAQTLLISLFLLYQLIYWNWLWPRSHARL